MSKSTRRRETRTNYGYTYWWGDGLKTFTDPIEIRPPSMADGGQWTEGPDTRLETQVTESENHSQWRRRRYGHFSGDIGGEFFTERTWIEKTTQPFLLWDVTENNGVYTRNYRYGPAYPINPFGGPLSYPSHTKSSDSVLNAWGAKAIAQCKPTNATADLATFLGESIREGIPKLLGANLWRDKTKEALRKKASKDYLNYQFGWKPIANEIGDVAFSIWNAQRSIDQFKRDSGRMVRRRFEFPPEITDSYSTVSSNASAYLPGYSRAGYRSGDRGRVIRRRYTETRRWFSGAFTYYVPKTSNAFERMNESALMARRTLGLSLTPDVVWNLAPWSWAIDWFTNTGDVLSNITDWAMYGQVLRYGYIMEHKISKDTYTLVDGTDLMSSYIPAPLSLCRETKVRRKANPFGFGITWSGLNPYQLAIAAALGITKLK
jgi:hypothetical protein